MGGQFRRQLKIKQLNENIQVTVMKVKGVDLYIAVWNEEVEKIKTSTIANIPWGSAENRNPTV